MYIRKLASDASSHNRRMFSGDKAEEEDVPRDITCEAVNDLRVVFATYQVGDSSSILLRHLVEIMQMMGAHAGKIPTSTKIAEMAGIDLSGVENPWEAKLGFKDFLRFFAVFNMSNKTVEVKSKDIFRAMDCDDSGEITAEELEESLNSMGMAVNSDEALAMTSIADTSNEGLISYAEFKSICKRIDRHAKEEDQKKEKKALDKPEKKKTGVLRALGERKNSTFLREISSNIFKDRENPRE